MHYVIMGCGRVGSGLALGLERRGESVAIIDTRPLAFRRLNPGFSGQAVTGNGFDRDTLLEAGIERAAGFAAVADGDNSNILAARVARESFGITNVVARIYDPGRAEVYERLGIPTVATVRWATEQVLGKLVDLGAECVWRDPSGTARLIQVRYAPGWVGQPIRALERTLRVPLPLVGRFGSAEPTTDDTTLQNQDVLYAMVPSERADEIHARLAKDPEGV